MVFDNILEAVGKTPLIKLNTLCERTVNVYGKAEFFLPTGSLKDRSAMFIVNDALANMKIGGNTKVAEAAAGNSAVSIAMVCAAKGLPCLLVMPENVHPDRIKAVRAYGAEVVLTPAAGGYEGAVSELEKLSRTQDLFILNQYANKAAADSHFATTAREIFTDLRSVKWIVAGIGTGATVIGITRYIIANRLDCRVCVVSPENNKLLEGGAAGRHIIRGIGASFVPKIVGDKTFDRIEYVSDAEAIEESRRLAVTEGIFCGLSGGAAVAAARRLVKEVEVGEIVVMLPDGGDKYYNSPLCDYD